MTSLAPTRLTAMLFVPGTAEDKLVKISDEPAGAFILDLEDAVAHDEKEEGRRCVSAALDRVGPAQAVYVRVNPVGTADFLKDIEAVVKPGLTGIDLPKVSTPAEVMAAEAIVAHYAARVTPAMAPVALMVTIETARGLRNVYDIAAAPARSLRRLCFGSGDLTRDLGLAPEPGSEASNAVLRHARVQLVLASRHAGLQAPHDSAYPRYRDLAALELESADARSLGFSGKHAIHPCQLAAILTAFRPTPEEVAHARSLVQAYDAAVADGRGAVGVDGELVDQAIVLRAREVLRDAEGDQG